MAGRSKLFQNFLTAAQGAVGPAVTSGALTGGLSLLGGASPLNALLYGATDALASGGSVAAVRALRPKSPRKIIDLQTGKTRVEPGVSRLQTPINIAASVGTGIGVSSLLGEGVMPTDVSQSQQILQENIQRDLINTRLAGKYANPNALSPGTMFQMQGLEGTLLEGQLQQILNAGGGGVDLSGMEAEMRALAGV
jgi:hypothetical protein